jgi:Fic family protein
LHRFIVFLLKHCNYYQEVSVSKQAKTKIEPRLEERLRAKKGELDQLRPLSPTTLERLFGDLRVLLTYHSNAIEGSSLTLRETQMIIEYGLTVSGKPLKDYLAATNHALALDYMLKLAESKHQITLANVLELHRLAMQNILPEAGQFRREPVYIRGANFTPPPASEVKGLLKEWQSWLYREGLQFEPLVRAAIAHHDFEVIHPFTDGNGRTGRLILNLMLLQAGYPPALLLRNWKRAYIKALESSTKGNYSPLINLIGRSVESGLDMYLASAKQIQTDPYRLLSELEAVSGLKKAHLGWLIRQGRLEGVKRGGKWYSTVEAIERYKAEVAAEVYPRGRPKEEA